MSYLLQVFQPPEGVSPSSPADVVAMVEALHLTSGSGDSPAGRTLVRLLKASASPAQRGEWMAALAEDDEGPVFNMLVETARADDLVALVVRCARTLRLAVLDQQAGVAYWPDGTEIRLAARPRSPGGPEAEMASQLGPIQLSAGEPYRLYCGYFSVNERALAEQLPEMLARNMRSRQVEPAEWMMELQARLVREFGGHAGAESIWAEDLVPARELFNVLPMAVKAERIRQVRPRILELVRSVDMNVFDPHAMQVHFADGHICWNGEHWWASWSEGGRVDAELPAAEVARQLARELERYGFAHDGQGHLVRAFPDVKQTVVVHGAHWDVQVYVVVEVTRVTDLPEHVAIPSLPEMRHTASIHAPLSVFVGDGDFDEPLFFDRQQNSTTIQRRAKIEPMAREIARVVVERVVPYCDARASVEAVHAAVNGPGAQQHPAWPVLPSTRLQIAYMAGEPRVAWMATQELEKLRAWKYDPGVRGLNRTEWERERPIAEALVEWLGARN